ncbi:MAG TPA: hypothetical protein VGD80_36485 [Kofleriaceae bacterium]
MDRHDEASGADYEQLRRHLQRPRREHPAGRQAERANPAGPPAASRVSVMDWLVSVGGAVARRLRRARSAMVRMHPKD